jgi:hypothetical protein
MTMQINVHAVINDASTASGAVNFATVQAFNAKTEDRGNFHEPEDVSPQLPQAQRILHHAALLVFAVIRRKRGENHGWM